jgi:hypothetical protein
MREARIALWVWAAFLCPVWADGNLQEWTTKSGQRIRADLVNYSWADRSLMLRSEKGNEALPVAAQDLDLRGKVQLLFAEPFQDCFLAHREEVSVLPTYQTRLGWLRQWGVILTGVSVAGMIGISWCLSRMLLGSGSLRFWFLVLSVAVGLGSLGYWAVSEARARFGVDKAAEVAGLVLVAHSVLLVFAIWAINGRGFFRALLWWFSHWILILVWPIVVTVAGLASQVYLHTRALDEPAMERYLSEVWLVPMGLI